MPVFYISYVIVLLAAVVLSVFIHFTHFLTGFVGYMIPQPYISACIHPRHRGGLVKAKELNKLTCHL